LKTIIIGRCSTKFEDQVQNFLLRHLSNVTTLKIKLWT